MQVLRCFGGDVVADDRMGGEEGRTDQGREAMADEKLTMKRSQPRPELSGRKLEPQLCHPPRESGRLLDDQACVLGCLLWIVCTMNRRRGRVMPVRPSETSRCGRGGRDSRGKTIVTRRDTAPR
ncbi:hypothetical protein CHU98_g11977 [Xylaria longipes]|nr:hypothetical protein CHU98_g11977 [Xylaria longipes]